MTIYDLFLHWKQGDDFATQLKAAGDDVPKALREWAKSFDENASRCRALAKLFDKVSISAQADTHHISFAPSEDIQRSKGFDEFFDHPESAVEALEEAVRQKLLTRDDLDD